MHYAVIDLGYGDAGKGILTARLTRQYNARWNVKLTGGAQCAHNVITDDGRHHTFAQFGSGTFDGAHTYLTGDFLVEPFALLKEADHLASLGVEKPLNRMWVNPLNIVITPYHWLLNRWLEDQRTGRHGSTGRGIGMTRLHSIEDPLHALRAQDIDEPFLSERLHHIREWAISKGMPSDMLPSVSNVREDYDCIRDRFRSVTYGGGSSSWGYTTRDTTIIFEGSQGVLLDEDYGFHPHTTWSRTTDRPMIDFVQSMRDRYELDLGPVTTIGVTRSYMTRHGHGPFPSEMTGMDVTELHNADAHYQGAWRTGMLDLVALKYAVDACVKVDGIYVTHMDQDQHYLPMITSYPNVELTQLPPNDFAARQRQSEALSEASVYGDYDETLDTAQRLSQALDLPLFGKGHGPKINEGVLGIPDDAGHVVESYIEDRTVAVDPASLSIDTAEPSPVL